MKQKIKRFSKKVGAWLLAIVMILSQLAPVGTFLTPAYAAGDESLTVAEQFKYVEPILIRIDDKWKKTMQRDPEWTYTMVRNNQGLNIEPDDLEFFCEPGDRAGNYLISAQLKPGKHPGVNIIIIPGILTVVRGIV